MNNEKKMVEYELVSVIMPVYNAEKTVQRAIQSVNAQSYPKWELIVVDDGSSDTSGLLCDHEASLDDRISVYHVDNNGVSAARNYGLNCARGELICFIDSDDTMCPHALRAIVESSTDSDLLIFGYNMYPSKCSMGFEETVFYSSFADFTNDFPKIHRFHLLNCVWNKCFKRSLIEKGNCSFPLNLSMGEDLLFVLSYIKACKNIKVINQVLYDYYTENAFSLSQVYRLDAFEIQRYLKEVTDASFHGSPSVVRITSNIFTNYIISELRKIVYSDDISREQKLSLIKRWIENPFFREQFSFIRSELPQNRCIKQIIQHNDVWGFYTYTSYLKKRSRVKQFLIKMMHLMK